MPKAKLVESSKNTWVRLDVLVTPDQYNLIKELSRVEDLSMAEVTRIMIAITRDLIVDDLEKAKERLSNFPKMTAH